MSAPPIHQISRDEPIVPMPDAAIKPDPYAPWRSRDYRCYACSWFAMTFAKKVETLAVSVYFVSIFTKPDAPLALGAMALVGCCR